MSAVFNKVSASSHTVTVNNVIFYFSYETCIAVQTKTVKIREANRWSKTTGKHFNKLGCKDFTIVSEGEFDRFVKSLG